jgi:thiosulfate/3-mercaptopyruvate sulfurtransferase
MKVNSPLFLLTALFASANVVAAPRIVDTGYVEAAAARGAIIWDVRAEADYNKGHIAGAVNVGDAGKVLRYENTEDYLPVDQIEKVLGDAGIDPSKEVIVYGAKANAGTYFGLLTLEQFGGANVHAYHGGLDDWKAAGKAVETTATKLVVVPLKLKIVNGITVTTEEVRKRLNSAKVQIVDVRTPKEYRGEDIRAIRGGHLPKAVNIPYEQNWVDPEAAKKLADKKITGTEGLALKPEAELKALYSKLDANKETIVYCQSGVRASYTATILKDIGFRNVKVYDSSWLGYGNTLDAPAENVVFFNVGLMNGKVAALQKRVDSLEKELAGSGKPQ